jgi:circadian clock protein KaiC
MVVAEVFLVSGNQEREESPDLPRHAARARLASGISGLDDVLGGGLFTDGFYLVSGGPGTGKTVMANQICFTHARDNRRCVYITMLSESHSRMILNLQSFAFFDEALAEHIAYLSGTTAVADGGLPALFNLIEEEIRRRQASFLVLDGFGLGARGTSETEQTTFSNRLAVLLEFSGCAGLICTFSHTGGVTPEYALADGVLELTNRHVGYRSVRELHVVKLRGSTSLEGSHVMEIDERGLVVYPRTEAKLARSLEVAGAPGEKLRFGITGLDEMLRGGIPSTSTTAIVGVTGAGKTLLGLHFLAEGAKQQQRGLYFGFHESPAWIVAQGDGIELGLGELCRANVLDLEWRPSFENYMDRITVEILDHVRQRDVQRLFIDGIESIIHNSPFRERSHAVLTALTNQLRGWGVTVLLSIESEIMGQRIVPPESWSTFVENTILLRYVELRSHLHRLLAVIKVRGSDFDSSLREFRISSEGIRVEATFESAQAVLSGIARVERNGFFEAGESDEEERG